MKIRFRIKHPSGYLLLQGLRLTIRDWPCLLWAWIISVPFCLFALSPVRLAAARWIETIEGKRFANGATPLLGRPLLDRLIGAAESQGAGLHWLAAHLTWASLQSLAIRSEWVRSPYSVAKGVWYAAALEIAALLFLVAGTLHVYLATEPPRLSRLFSYSAKSILGFLRALILGSILAAPLLAALIFARHALLVRMTRTQSAHAVLLSSNISAAVLVLIALALLLFVDLVETHAMRRRIRGDHEVRRSLVPALRLLVHQFFWISPTFLLPYAAALGSLVASAYGWRSLLLANHLWIAYLAAQAGFFLLLSARFWQRGMEVALIVAVERSNTIATVLSEAHTQPQQADQKQENPKQENQKQANPTLQELVQKLKQEPWARTDVPPLKTLFPEIPRERKTRPTAILPSAPAPPSSSATPAPLPSAAAAPSPATPIPSPATAAPSSSTAITSPVPTDAAKANPQPASAAQASLPSLLAEHAKKTPLVEATSEAASETTSGEPLAQSPAEEAKPESKPGPEPDKSRNPSKN